MTKIQVKGSVVFVTGSNRGIGKAFVTQALKHNAKKVYASARNSDSVKDLVALDSAKVIPIALDVTSRSQVEAAAHQASDTTILINNAGIATYSGFTTVSNLQSAQKELDVNYLAVVSMAQLFAPILKQNGGGALVNLGSVASFTSFPFSAGYSASKAATHSLTQALRTELARQRTFVAGVYPGPIDTDMAKGFEAEKETPKNVADYVYDALDQGEEDIFPDKFAQNFMASIRSDAKAVERQNAAMAQ
jgi:short-subunit dehydrogenase